MGKTNKKDTLDFLDKHKGGMATYEIVPVYDNSRKKEKFNTDLSGEFIQKFIGQVNDEDKIDISTYDTRISDFSGIIYIVKESNGDHVSLVLRDINI